MKKIILLAIIASTIFSLPTFAQQTYIATDVNGKRIDSVIYYSLESAQAAANAYDLRQKQQLTQTFTAKDENGNVIGVYASQLEAQNATNADYMRRHPAPAQGNTNQQPAEDPYLTRKKALDLQKDQETVKALKLQNANSKITILNNGITTVGNGVGTGVYIGQQLGLIGNGGGRAQFNRCRYCNVTYVGTQHVCNQSGVGGVMPPNSGYNGSYCQGCRQTYYGGNHSCGTTGFGQQTQGCFCTYYQGQGYVPNQYGTGTWCTWRMNSNGSGYGWFPSTQQGGCGNQYGDGMFHTPIINRFDNGGPVPGAQYGVRIY